MKELYSVLGLEKGASKEEIAKAYRNLALKYHPDRNSGNKESESKFKEIAAAHEVLSDDRKRAEYDQFGSTGKRFHSVHDDFLRSFFRKSPFGEQQFRLCGRNIMVEHVVTLEQVLNGDDVVITYRKRSVCSDCKGLGGKESVCPECNGKKFRVIHGQAMTVMAPCQMCEETGKMIIEVCDKCSDGFVDASGDSSVNFKVPKGVEEGMRFGFTGHGEPVAGGKTGDLFIVIKVKPHEFFERLPNGNILCKAPVSYTQLVFGDTIEVPGLKGKISVEVPAGTSSHNKFRLKGQGLPVFTNRGGIHKIGDQLVRVELEVPTNLVGEYKEIVERLVEFEKGE